MTSAPRNRAAPDPGRAAPVPPAAPRVSPGAPRASRGAPRPAHAHGLAAHDPGSIKLVEPRQTQRPVPVSRQPQQPVALLYGPGQQIVHGNTAFVAEFGGGVVGLPAREVLLSVPAPLFDVVDRVRTLGRPLACWLDVAGERRRLTATPRRDPETDEIYGVAIRLAHAAPD